MKNHIQEITSLEQLDECLAACRATPASEVMNGGSFYKLKCQEFNYPNGTRQRREYVDKRPSTIVVPENHYGNFIMVIQPTALVKEGSLIEFPAGYAEADEDDKTVAICELLEETGLTTEPQYITDLGSHYQEPELIRQPVNAYLAECCCTRCFESKPDDGEYIELYEVSKSMFMQMLRTGYIKDANTYFAGIQALIKLPFLGWRC